MSGSFASIIDQVLRSANAPDAFITPKVDGMVKGSRLCAYVDALPEQKAYRAGIITQAAGVDFILPDTWYPTQVEVDALLRFERELGAFTLEALGRGVAERTAPMFPELAHALVGLNQWYQEEHQGDGHGEFELLEVREAGRRALIRSTSKSPDAFELGLISAFLQRHTKPARSRVQVHADARKPSRKNGYDNTTYVVMW